MKPIIPPEQIKELQQALEEVLATEDAKYLTKGAIKAMRQYANGYITSEQLDRLIQRDLRKYRAFV